MKISGARVLEPTVSLQISNRRVLCGSRELEKMNDDGGRSFLMVAVVDSDSFDSGFRERERGWETGKWVSNR